MAYKRNNKTEFAKEFTDQLLDSWDDRRDKWSTRELLVVVCGGLIMAIAMLVVLTATVIVLFSNSGVTTGASTEAERYSSVSTTELYDLKISR